MDKNGIGLALILVVGGLFILVTTGIAISATCFVLAAASLVVAASNRFKRETYTETVHGN